MLPGFWPDIKTHPTMWVWSNWFETEPANKLVSILCGIKKTSGVYLQYSYPSWFDKSSAAFFKLCLEKNNLSPHIRILIRIWAETNIAHILRSQPTGLAISHKIFKLLFTSESSTMRGWSSELQVSECLHLWEALIWYPITNQVALTRS